jgi:hypothetical protein
VHRLPPQTLAFLAPGLLHQFGNQLFAIQGNAQLLPDSTGDLRAKILAAAARGGETLRVFRAVLGDAAPLRMSLARAIEPLFEVARVPLREHGHRLDCRGGGDEAHTVDAVAVVAAAATALCALVEEVPSGAIGTFGFELGSTSTAATVAVRFAPVAGCLPFPLAVDSVVQRLRRVLPAGPNGPSCRHLEAGVELAFPHAVASFQREA